MGSPLSSAMSPISETTSTCSLTVLQVILLLWVKISKAHIAEGANPRKMSGGDCGFPWQTTSVFGTTSSPVSKISTVPLSSFLLLIERSSVLDTARRNQERLRLGASLVTCDFWPKRGGLRPQILRLRREHRRNEAGTEAGRRTILTSGALSGSHVR